MISVYATDCEACALFADEFPDAVAQKWTPKDEFRYARLHHDHERSLKRAITRLRETLDRVERVSSGYRHMGGEYESGSVAVADAIRPIHHPNRAYEIGVRRPDPEHPGWDIVGDVDIPAIPHSTESGR